MSEKITKVEHLKSLAQKKEDFLAILAAFDKAVYKMSEAWEDRELADKIHGNPQIMEVVAQIFPMSVDEWWHGISHMREVITKEFNPRLTTRQLRSELYGLLDSDKPVLVYTGGWYYYVTSVSPRAEEEGALPVIELGDAFDSRDL